MEWTDRAVMLSARPFGEGKAVAHALTETHGRHAGLVQGARRHAGALQPGTLATVRWRARLSDQLGTFSCEVETAHAALWLDDPARLAALQSACAVAELGLPEREPHPAAFLGLAAFLETLAGDAWPAAYVGYEVALLAELGFGLDLERCAVTGGRTGLAWVSPRSGRAVTAEAGEQWKERLLALPGFLSGAPGFTTGDISDGLALTGHFLARHIAGPVDRPLPAARLRLADCFAG
ncbi:MAG: DNA repair protein RecO [Alphaproteobacteria bacterium]|nr:DNA repair protein RecO [Alphaproteobacteria bacterium]